MIMDDKKIMISEVVPRDGWQNIKKYIPKETKIKYIKKILDSGVNHIQIGSFVSPKAVPQMQDSAEIFQILQREYENARFFALIPNVYGAEKAYACGVREVSYVISVSESHNMANVNKSIDDSIAALRTIRNEFSDYTIHLDAATAFGCPYEGFTTLDKLLFFIDKVASIGINMINLCDTIGVAIPSQVERYIQTVMRKFPEIPLEVHIHDTRNMGMLNTWIAIQNGVERVQTSLGGLGGCPFAPGASGNTATEDLVNMLHQEGFYTGIDNEKLLQTAKEMQSEIEGNYSGHLIRIGSCVTSY